MNDEFKLDERVLCEDDACIGLVGLDGLCKVCGRPYTGPEILPKAGETQNGEDNVSAPNPPAAALTPSDAEPSDEEGAADADERVLCPDDTCIGIIGPDGACGTCGKRT